MKHKNLLPIVAVCLTAVASGTTEARVTRFVVERRVPLANSGQWGPTGAYEKLLGTAYMEVDPRDPINAVIVNLDKAPRNARGMVEFSSPFVILKPVDLARGNRKIWFGLNNRGGCIDLYNHSMPMISSAQLTCNPASIDQIGANNSFLRNGYAWVDAGWHGDGIAVEDRSKLYPAFPIAKNPDGSSIVGPNRLEFQPSTATFTMPFASGWHAYEVVDGSTSAATLTVRDRSDGPRTAIEADRWAFASCPQGPNSRTPSSTEVCLFDGFQPRKIYELIYQAKDPIVMGLAYAVPRDIASFLRNQIQDDAGNPNPLAISSQTVGVRRTYLSGTSSTGMYMREFVYLGFNEDEQHRKVFDGVAVYSAGTHRLFANVQFAHPTFYSGQDQHRDYTSNSVAPFSLAITTDPITGIKDGILKRPATDPYLLQADEELVFWQWKASLNVADAQGKPLPIPDNARLYHMNGWGHIGATGLLSPPNALPNCAHPFNGSGAMPTMARAMVEILDDWADGGIAPPTSNYPQVQDGTLVSLSEYRRQFPKIPGLEPPMVLNELSALDFGPDFNSTGGIQSIQPPRVVDASSDAAAGAKQTDKYAVLVPRPGPDGGAAVGIGTIWTRAPLGSSVGWNLQTSPRQGELCSLAGSFVPLAKTRAERTASGDPRLSLEERYKNQQGFVRAVKKASAQLVEERFMLQEDADILVKAAQESAVLAQ
jgi:hypothetical protein